MCHSKPMKPVENIVLLRLSDEAAENSALVLVRNAYVVGIGEAKEKL